VPSFPPHAAAGEGAGRGQATAEPALGEVGINPLGEVGINALGEVGINPDAPRRGARAY
jgi:hypothetical protein